MGSASPLHCKDRIGVTCAICQGRAPLLFQEGAAACRAARSREEVSKLGLSGFPVAAARARGEAAGALLCSALSALICRSALLVRIAGRKRPGGPFEHQLCLVPAMLLSSVCLSLSLSQWSLCLCRRRRLRLLQAQGKRQEICGTSRRGSRITCAALREGFWPFALAGGEIGAARAED